MVNTFTLKHSNDRGTTSDIYLLRGNGNEEYVGKVLKTNNFFQSDLTLRSLEKEFEFAKDLFENNVVVPMPVGISKISISKFFPFKFNAYLSKYISGIDFWDFYSGKHLEFFERASYFASLELEKAKELGYVPVDYVLNALYSIEEDKSYLFDFADWKYFGKNEKLKKFN